MLSMNYSWYFVCCLLFTGSLLSAERVTEDLDVEDGMEPAESTSVGMGARVKRILLAADDFLASKPVAEELRAMKARRINKGLAQYGLTVEDRFRTRVLRSYLEVEVADESSAFWSDSELQLSPPSEKQITPGESEDTQGVCTEDWIENELEKKHVDKRDETVYINAQTALQSYCLYRKDIAQSQQPPSLKNKKGLRSSINFKENGLKASMGKRGKDPAAAAKMQNFRLQQAEKTRVKLGVLRAFLEDEKQSEVQARLRSIHPQVLAMKQAAEDYKKILDDTQRVDWAGEAAKAKTKTSLFSKAKLMLSSLWCKEKQETEKQEKRCTQRAAELSQKAAKDNEGMDDVALAEKTLSEVSKESRAEAGSEEEVQKRVSIVKQDSEEIQETLTSNGDQKKSIAKAVEKAKDMDKNVDDSADSVCADTNSKESNSLKQLVEEVKANKALLPTLLIRGSSVQVGSFVVATEEVVDLRNLEIGQFLATSISVGSSMHGIGAGGYIGVADKGYKEDWTLEEAYQTGLGVTAGFYGATVSLITDADNSYTEWPAPFWKPDPLGVNTLSVGLSVGGPLMDGVNAAAGTIGTAGSIVTGAAAAATVLPNSLLQTNATESLRVGIDVAATKAIMINSECYDTMDELKGYMMNPFSQKHTQSKGEKQLIGGYRFLSRVGLYAGGATNGAMAGVAGGPFGMLAGAFAGTLAAVVLPEITFRALAGLYDHHYGPKSKYGKKYKRRCSSASTNNRHNSTNFLRQLDQILQDATETVVQLEGLEATTRQLLESTLPSKWHSLEFRKFKDKVSKCSDAPAGVYNEKQAYDVLEPLSKEDLKTSCETSDFKICDGLTKDRMADKLVLWQDVQDDVYGLEELQHLYDLMQKMSSKVPNLAAKDEAKPKTGWFSKLFGGKKVSTTTTTTTTTENTKADKSAVLKAIDRCKKRVKKGKTEADACLKGKKLYRITRRDLLNKDQLLKAMCDELVEGDCVPQPSKGLFGLGAKKELADNERLLLILLKGMNGKAKLSDSPDKDGKPIRVNAFGSCDEDSDCSAVTPNTECQKMRTGYSVCRCKKTTCFLIDSRTGDSQCSSEEGMDGLDEKGVMDQVAQTIFGMKTSIGQMSQRLQDVANDISETKSQGEAEKSADPESAE
eukprot:TRINITY_DN24818_c0_g1_i1.p1 TRINITY_DN24818_c0_g1~~TRINITY_DN24818_c0_g1_i1.p1  ORF type:complete len:1138 (-),score=195.42 TRINITY_DN24818_c0_g1_i1:75-3488(-)